MLAHFYEGSVNIIHVIPINVPYKRNVCLFVVFFTAQQHTRAIIVPIKFVINEINDTDKTFRFTE